MKSKISTLQSTAQKLAAKGEYDQAINALTTLLSHREDGNIYNSIGDLHLKKGATKAAAQAFSKAATLFRKDGFDQKAIALYKKALHVMPAHVETLLALADLRVSQGFANLAVDHLMKAANIYTRNNDIPRAIDIYEKILHINPFDVNMRLKVIDFYRQMGFKERAANGYAAIASDHAQNEDFDSAMKYYRQAVEVDSRNIPSFLGMSKVAEKKDDLDAALQHLEQARSIAPDDRTVLLSYATLALQRERLDDAREALERAIAKDPADLHAKSLLGDIYLNEGNLNAAWEELVPHIDDLIKENILTDAMELLVQFKDSHPVPVKKRLITIYRGKSDEASLLSAMKGLAELYEKEGSLEEALHVYREALDEAPSDGTVQRKITGLEEMLQKKADGEEPSAASEPAPPVQSEAESLPGDLLESLAEADFYAQQGLVEEATGLYEKLLQKAPGNDEIRQKLDSLGQSREQEQAHTPEEPPAIPEDFQESLAEADFYAQQGLVEEATGLYEKLLQKAPGNDEIRQKLDSLGQSREQEQAHTPEEPPAIPEDFQESLAEADFFAEQGLFEEASGIYEKLLEIVPGHEEIGQKLLALKSMPVTEESHAQSIPDTDTHPDGEGEHITDGAQGLSQGSDDGEIHYNQGITYKEQGALDEAIEEFLMAAGDPDKELLSLRMIALCYVEKGDYPHAITQFYRILETLTPTDERYLEIKYELAETHMHSTNTDEAFAIYSEIYGRDPEFKDVADRVSLLKSEMSEARKKIHRTKDDRISYL